MSEHDGFGHFRIDLHQAPQAIVAFRQAAQEMRDLMFEANLLAHQAEFAAPGKDGVSGQAVGDIARWAASEEPGSLGAALESGAIQLERAAEALGRSLASYQHTEEINAAPLRGLQL